MEKQKSNEIALDSERFSRFCEIIVELLGLHLSEKDKKDVEKRLHATCQEFGFSNTNDFVDWLAGSRLSHDQITLFAKHFTVGETYFFRDTSLFTLFEKKILPELIQKRQNNGRYIRVWCSACCTGEEPYSLAILLDRLIPDIEAWDILILGTDINPIFLRKAEQGIYKKWSFRATPEGIRHRYFTEDKHGHFKIIPKINKMVHFTCLNLIEDKYPALINQTHTMDLIICNNVLIYFTKEKIKYTIHHLTDSLVESGILLVSALEVPYVQDERLVPHLLDSVTLFQKELNLQKAIVAPITPVSSKKQPILPLPLAPVELKKIEEKENLYSELYENGNYDEVIKKLEKKLGNESGQPDGGKLVILLARSYANKGETEKAKKCLEKALQNEKLNPELYFFYSTLLQELGQLPEAIAALKKSLFLDQNYVISYYALGNILLGLGKTEEADRNFRNALLLLEKMESNSFLIELGGITVGSLMEIISFIQKQIYSNK
jgi:chemotaxis protein methyltransferase CheR